MTVLTDTALETGVAIAAPEGLRELVSAAEVRAAVESLADAIDEAFRDAPVVNLVPVMAGGLHLAAALSTALERRTPGKWLLAPIYASTYAADGELAEPHIDLTPRFDHQIDASGPIVIVDDLLDSGTTMSALVTLLRERGLDPVRVCVLIDKVGKRRVPIAADFCGFQLPEDAWLVGFGMDSGRRHRGLDAVYVRDDA